MTRLKTFLSAAVLLASAPAVAHPGHGPATAFLHPLSGLDHLCAAITMLGFVALVARLIRARARPRPFVDGGGPKR